MYLDGEETQGRCAGCRHDPAILDATTTYTIRVEAAGPETPEREWARNGRHHVG